MPAESKEAILSFFASLGLNSTVISADALIISSLYRKSKIFLKYSTGTREGVPPPKYTD